jgi:hypothetical protein
VLESASPERLAAIADPAELRSTRDTGSNYADEDRSRLHVRNGDLFDDGFAVFDQQLFHSPVPRRISIETSL